MNKSILPIPSLLIQGQSSDLFQLIRAEIMSAPHRFITFARFMELALYAPGLGYYSSSLQKFGLGGDFITAPEISPLFGQCIALQCEQILSFVGHGEILEIGAGKGTLAVDILKELEHKNSLPLHYLILEISPSLIKVQQKTIASKIPHLFDRVHWIQGFPSKPFSGIILANEVLDAMPVHKFLIKENNFFEYGVSIKENEFFFKAVEPSDILLREIKKIKKRYLEEFLYYESEISFYIPGWLKNLSLCLKQGAVFLIDYGFPATEYYHPDRWMGTIMCHYQHFTHPDPLVVIGLQDITAHVNFSLVAQIASKFNLAVKGYTSQAAFLLSCGLLKLSEERYNLESRFKVNQEIMRLTSPAEMGELVKVIGLSRNLEELDFLGFKISDRRHQLLKI